MSGARTSSALNRSRFDRKRTASHGVASRPKKLSSASSRQALRNTSSPSSNGAPPKSTRPVRRRARATSSPALMSSRLSTSASSILSAIRETALCSIGTFSGPLAQIPGLLRGTSRAPIRPGTTRSTELGAHLHWPCGYYIRRDLGFDPRNRRSDRLQDLLPRDVRRQDLAPVDFARQHFESGAQAVVTRRQPGRVAALLDGLDRLSQETAHLDDRLVGGAEMLFAAVDDPSHAFLDCAVLHVDPIDPSKALGPLHLAIDQIVVLAVGLGTEGRLIDVKRPIAEPALKPVLFIQGLVGAGVCPVVDHRVLVVDRHPDMPCIGGVTALG